MSLIGDHTKDSTATPRTVQIRTLRQPLDFPWPTNTQDKRRPGDDEQQRGGDAPWRQLNQTETNDTTATNQLTTHLCTKRYNDLNELGDQLACSFLTWARTAERYHHAQLQPTEPVARYMGRFQHPTFRIIQPTPPDPPPGGPALSPARCADAEWWGHTLALLHELATLNTRRERDNITNSAHHRMQTWSTIRRLRKHLQRTPNDDVAQWQATLNQLSFTTPAERIKEHITTATQRYNTHLHKHYSDSRKGFTRWILDTDPRHHRHLYKWIKQPLTQGLLADHDLQTGASTSLEMADRRAQVWSAYWQRDAGNDDELHKLKLHLMHQAKHDPLPDITLQRFDQAVASHSDRTGHGIDHIGPSFFRRLPEAGRRQFVSLLNTCQKTMHWPTTLLLNIIATTPKPGGTDAGERPICLLPYSLRAWQRCHKSGGAEWSTQHAGFWDDCIKGSSSLQAALVRMLKDEVAHEWGLAVGTILWDLTKYYDSISLPKLFTAMERLHYNTTMLVLLMDLYTAPRTIRAGQCYTTPLHIFTSITQGCSRAIDMARGMVYSLLEDMHIQHPRINIREWVDDLHHRVQGTATFVKQELVTSAQRLVTGLRRLNLTISTKSTVVTTHKDITEIVTQTLQRTHNLTLGHSLTGRDLGLDNAVGTRRRTGTTAQRKQKARLRHVRISKIARLGGPGIKLQYYVEKIFV